MSDISAIMYMYRNNFSGKKSRKRPFKREKSLILLDLLRPGYMDYQIEDIDLSIAIAQWFMKHGYPRNLSVNNSAQKQLLKFFVKILFAVESWPIEDLRINSGFRLLEWREQFNLQKTFCFRGIKFYRNRGAIPIKEFSSFRDITQVIYDEKEGEKLQFSPNQCHKKAIYIHSRYTLVYKDHFVYRIAYDHKKTNGCWHYDIKSDINENYIDFCLRIHDNYDKILKGDKSILISQYEDDPKNFYLGGRFELRKTLKNGKK